VSEQTPASTGRWPRGRWTGVPLLAAAAVLILAILSVVWPDASGTNAEGTLLVLDPLGDLRGEGVYAPLARVCGEAADRDLSVAVARTVESFLAVADDAVLVVCPDGVALRLPPRRFDPLVTGRKRAPQNLRPSTVLLYRKAAGRRERPWRDVPGRTVLGDTLSLACRAPLCDGDAPAPVPAGVASGVDPYDHAAVVEAARLGGFDYLVVRQWAAESCFAAGLLDTATWAMERLTDPLPGLLVLANTGWLNPTDRLALREVLIGLGRGGDPATVHDQICLAGLATLGLDGFHLLLEPDFERLRRRYGPCWPPRSE